MPEDSGGGRGILHIRRGNEGEEHLRFLLVCMIVVKSSRQCSLNSHHHGCDCCQDDNMKEEKRVHLSAHNSKQ